MPGEFLHGPFRCPTHRQMRAERMPVCRAGYCRRLRAPPVLASRRYARVVSALRPMSWRRTPLRLLVSVIAPSVCLARRRGAAIRLDQTACKMSSSRPVNPAILKIDRAVPFAISE